MTQDERDELTERLTRLADLLDSPMTPTRLVGYCATLDEWPSAEVFWAVNECAVTMKYFPKPVEIIAIARQRQSERAADEYRSQRDFRQAQREADDEMQPAQLTAPEPKALAEHVLTEEELAEAERRRLEAVEAARAQLRGVIKQFPPPPSPHARRPRRTLEQRLETDLRVHLPSWVDACRSATAEMVVLSQDAFHLEEFDLLAKAVKFAGLCGKAVTITPGTGVEELAADSVASGGP